MEANDDASVYYVVDFEGEQSDTDSIDTTTSGFTEHSMSTLTSSEVSGELQLAYDPSNLELTHTRLFL